MYKNLSKKLQEFWSYPFLAEKLNPKLIFTIKFSFTIGLKRNKEREKLNHGGEN